MYKTFLNNPLVYLARMVWRYSEGNRRIVVLYALLSALASSVWALEPLIVGYMLNEIQTNGFHGENARTIILLLAAFFSIDFIGWALHGPARVLEMRNAFFVRANYRKHLLAGTMALPIEWHTDHHSGDTIDKIEKGANALFEFNENSFQVIQAVVILIAGVSALLFYDAFAVGIVLVLSVPTFYVLAKFDKRLVPGYKRVSALENELSAKVYDTISNVTSVIILRVESLVHKSLETAIEKPFAQFKVNATLNEWKWFSASILGRLAAVAVISLYLWQALALGTVMIGTIYILYGYVDRIRGVFFQFAYLYNDIIRQRARVSNAEDLSKDFRDVTRSKKNRLPKGWSTLTVNDLSFSYGGNESEELAIDRVSMTIRKGERIAVIGESGGGKSTYLKLLRDLYHPKSLSLSVGNENIKGGFAAIENSISLVPQDPEIFATTIRENITLGVEYPESHIRVFTDMAAFTDVVTHLPKGLESSIVEKGVNLSGGEKQRLALARGLLASEHKDIVLLDEPTSSVDFGNELKIYGNIFESFPGKTILSSIHRLHLLSLFDNVYLFKGGKIAASGTFEELKEKSPDFKELWERYIKERDRLETAE